MPERPDDNKCPDFAAMAKEGKIESADIEQIISCFGKRLERFANMQCRNETQGEDALQDTMINLIQNLDAYRGDAPIEYWLRRMVVGACSRLKRGKKNAPNVNLPLDETVVGPLADKRPDAETLHDLRSEIDRLGRALKSLPELNRTLFYLHDGEGRSINELSASFGLTAEAVKSRLKRTRAQLRNELAV